MQKTVQTLIVFLLIPVLAFAQSSNSGSDKITKEENIRILLNALDTALGEKIVDLITEQGETIVFDEAEAFSTPIANVVIVPIESSLSEVKRLAYVKLFNGQQYLLTVERNNGLLNIYFPSGTTVVIDTSQSNIEINDLGAQLQEYDDINNTIDVTQMWWGGMWWMYLWMVIWMFFMMPIGFPMM